MKIIFKTEELEHLSDMSCYNNNYYKLPIIVQDCTKILEKCDEYMDENAYYLIPEDGNYYYPKPFFQSSHEMDPVITLTIENGIVILEDRWT